MLKKKSQEIADAALLPVINRLKKLIREGNEATATIGALKLILIGTRAATEALIDLIRTSEYRELTEMLAPLVILSPFRDEYRAELELFVSEKMIAEAYADAASLDPLILQEPAWVTVAEALEAASENKLDAVLRFMDEAIET